MAEYTAVLNNISLALRAADEGSSVSQLVRDVREAIRGRGEPTLRTAILQMQNEIVRSLHDLRNTLTGGPGTPAGGPPRVGGPAGALGPQDQNNLRRIASGVEAANQNFNEIRNQLSAMTEFLGHGAAHGGGITPFEAHAFSVRVTEVENLIRRANEGTISATGVLRSAFSDFRDLFSTQVQASQKDAVLGLVNLATRTTDLIAAFDRLGHFIKTQIVERYTGYLANRSGNLSAEEYYLDDIKRLWGYLRGTRPEVGFSYAATQEGVKNSLSSGLTSPLLMYGKNVEELSFAIRQLREDMAQRGVNPQQFGSQAQFEQLVAVLTERDKAMGPFQQMRSNEAVAAQTSSLRYLADIAKYTGASTDQLIKLVQSTTQEASELQAMGILSADQAKNFQQFSIGLQQLGSQGKFMADLLSKWIASGGNAAMFYRNNKDMATADSMFGGKLTEFLSQFGTLSTKQGDYAQKQAEVTRLVTQYAPALSNRFGPGQREAMYADYPIVAKIGAAFNSLAGNAPGQLAAPSERGWMDRLSTTIEDFGNRFSMFKDGVYGIVNVVGEFGKHVLEFYAAAKLIRLVGGGGAAAAETGIAGAAGGALATLGRLAGTVARVAAPVLGGAGAAGAAYLAGDSTAGIVGAGGGGTAGAMIGGALMSWAPGVGTAIGVAAGGYLGSKIGEWLGEKMNGTAGGSIVSPAAAAPAVPPPENIVGPDPSAVTATMAMTDLTRNLHGEQMQVLNGMLNASVDGNNIMSQMYSELQRHTSLITGQTPAPSAGLPARGLVSNTSPFTAVSRPEAAYPYGPANP